MATHSTIPGGKISWTEESGRLEPLGSQSQTGLSMQPHTRMYLCLCAQSCTIIFNPLDYSPPSSSVHGISQARILEWIAVSFSRASPNLGIEPVLLCLLLCRQVLYPLFFFLCHTMQPVGS